MKNYHIIGFFILMLAAFSCKTQPEKKDQEQPKAAAQVVTSEVLNSQSFKTKMTELEGVQLVDVRTPEEFSDGIIEGAQNINLFDSNFEETIGSLDKSKPIMVYCKRGSRSAKAARTLKKLGFTQIYDLDGGYLGWKGDDLPTTKPGS